MKRFILTGTPGAGKTATLGFIRPTEARRISQEDALRFEALHEKTYRAHGFELIPIEPGSVLDRVAAVRSAL